MEKRYLAEKETSFLVIIDVQNKLYPHVLEKENLLKNLVKVVKFARLLEIPIIITEQNKLGETIPQLKKSLGKFYSPIKKMSFSCVLETDFRDKLNELNRDTCILTGIESHICIQQTAFDMVNTGYIVHVVKDAISSRKSIDLENSIEKMRSSGIIVTTAEMIMYELIKTADDEKFKKFLEIVKTER